MVERKEESSSGMNEDELVEYACQLFEGKVVPYWKLQSPQPLKVIEDSFKPRAVSKEEAAAVVADKKQREAREWWQSRARRLIGDHRSRFADLATAEVGTRHSPELNQQVRERMKVAKK